MLTFGWGKPACAAVQTQSNESARPFAPNRDATVGIKIITKAFHPSDLLGGTCLGAVPVFSKCLAEALVLLRERGKKGCKGEFALGGSGGHICPAVLCQVTRATAPNPPSFPGNQLGKAGLSQIFQKMELKSLPCEIVKGLSVPGEYGRTGIAPGKLP